MVCTYVCTYNSKIMHNASCIILTSACKCEHAHVVCEQVAMLLAWWVQLLITMCARVLAMSIKTLITNKYYVVVPNKMFHAKHVL